MLTGGLPGRVAALLMSLAVTVGGWRPAAAASAQVRPGVAAQLPAAAAEAFARLLPAVRPTHQPDAVSPAHRPTLFATNVDQTQTFTETLLDRRVTITMRAVWAWDFGDGNTLVTTKPGGVYPDTSVSHVYARAGPHTVKLTAIWTGAYRVDGGSAQPIPGRFARASPPFIVDVRDAGAVLVT